MKTAASVLIALAIGGGCRYFSVPVPAPPSLLGVALIGCMTAGYLVVDWWIK